ncbi:MAG: hypothetical protein MR620_10785, partial [Clostridiales bacterium]|nr:hypothetical protein [Clostridiales bacterium]
CNAIWVLLRQWKSSKWHLLRKKSAKSSILLAAKFLFYFIVRLTGRGSESCVGFLRMSEGNDLIRRLRAAPSPEGKAGVQVLL